MIIPVTKSLKNSIIDPLNSRGDVIPPSIKSSVLAFWDARYANYADITQWTDYSGNSHTMTLSDCAWGETPPSLTFDGAASYGVVADSTATRMIAGGAITVWTKPLGYGESSTGRIIDKSIDITSTNGYLAYVTTNNVLYFNAGGAATPLVSFNNAVALSTWQHIAVTFSSTGRHLYVNGVDVTASGGSQTALPPNVAGVVTIGNRSGATDRTFNGYMGQIGIFSRPLIPYEIWQIYNASRVWYP